MTNIIEQYKKILASVPEIIEISGYKNEYIARKLNMQPGYFSAKKQKGSWTIDEVDQILKTISNNDVEDYLDKIFIKDSFDGNAMDASTFENKMGWK